jgi:hypothetical protein
MKQKQISEKEFADAQAVIQRMKGTVRLREQLAAEGKVNKELALPSPIWQYAAGFFSYFFNPTRELVDTLRLHTFTFTGHYLGPFNDPTSVTMPRSLRLQYHWMIKGLPNELLADSPRICGEAGWEENGRIINEDTLAYQRHLSTLYRSGVIDALKKKQQLSILEIGGGYGGLAFSLKQLFPQAKYAMIDLPESLVFPAIYLNVAFNESVPPQSFYDGNDSRALVMDGSDFVFVPNFLMRELLTTGRKFDFIINTGSFGEMTRAQVEDYADFIETILKDDGICYDDNQSTFIPVPEILGKHLKQGSWNRTLARIWAKKESVLKDLDANAAKIAAKPGEPSAFRVKSKEAYAKLLGRLGR